MLKSIGIRGEKKKQFMKEVRTNFLMKDLKKVRMQFNGEAREVAQTCADELWYQWLKEVDGNALRSERSICRDLKHWDHFIDFATTTTYIMDPDDRWAGMGWKDPASQPVIVAPVCCTKTRNRLHCVRVRVVCVP